VGVSNSHEPKLGNENVVTDRWLGYDHSLLVLLNAKYFSISLSYDAPYLPFNVEDKVFCGFVN
jgi:hypothetical protein